MIYFEGWCRILTTDVSSRAAGFNLDLSVYVFFTLKDFVPIALHYRTDRLQRFELKNLHLCSTEETKSPTSWMLWG